MDDKNKKEIKIDNTLEDSLDNKIPRIVHDVVKSEESKKIKNMGNVNCIGGKIVK